VQSRPVSGTADDWERLVGGVPVAACLGLVLDGPPDARLRLTKLASEKGELIDCDTSGREGTTVASQALRERAAELGVRMGWRETSLLLTTVGADCGRLVSELEKIAIYCSGRAPTESDILSLCARTAEGDIWQLLDAVDTGRADEALRIVRAALGRGESPVALVASLASQLRMMSRALERVESGVPPQALAVALGANRYWVEQSLRRARGFPLAAMYDAICALARLDRAIKTGTQDGASGIENVVLALASARWPRGR
jgi:DNA polymerase-3 subunit delta